MGANLNEKQTRQAPGVRFGARFWDAVEYEIETLDAADFELFVVADRLPFEPGPGVTVALGASLAALCRARFSN